MSATINVGLFTKFFEEEKTALIEVPGRLYPIKTYYMPIIRTDFQSKSRAKDERLNPEPYIQILNLVDQKYPSKYVLLLPLSSDQFTDRPITFQYELVNEKGDMLIFVSGVNEIETVMDAAKEYAEKQNHWIILPLHSGLSLADQDKVRYHFCKTDLPLNLCMLTIQLNISRFSTMLQTECESVSFLRILLKLL